MSEFPVSSFYFAVDFRGLGKTSFQEISGLEVSIEAENLEGGNDTQAAPAPMKRKFGNVTMKRGVVKSNSPIFDWVNNTFHPVNNNSKVEPKDIYIELLDPGADEFGMPIMVWEAIGAYPIKYSFSNLHSQKSELMMETIEFTVQELKIVFNS